MKAVPFAETRERMVDSQIVARGIADPKVIQAMRRVPRHRFVPDDLQHRAYDDRPLDIGRSQTISQPYMVALMTELLALRPTDRVLEIGTGSGYQAGILSTLAAEVVSVERLESLAVEARQRLHTLGYDNVTVVVGDGTLGWPERAPYDAIIVTAAAPRVPSALTDQLAEGGRLVCPVGSRDMQRLVKVARTAGQCETEHGIRCIFVPLIGHEGWADNEY